MIDVLTEQARVRPDAVALDATGAKWTYAELDDHASQLARRLAGAGLRPGSTVATLLPEGPQSVATIHAVPRAGATLAPLNTRWTERELVEHLDLVRPDMLVCNAKTERTAALVNKAPPMVTLDESVGTRAVALTGLPRAEGALPGLAPEQPHTILATSGTSGTPRAVELSLDGHLKLAEAAAKRLELGPEDRWLHLLSTAHVGGLALVLRAAVTGASVVHRGPFQPEAFCRLAEQGTVTHASLVPTMLRRVVEEQRGRSAPAGLRLLLVGGASVPRWLLRQALEQRLPVSLTYGMTETSSQVTTAPPDLVRRKPGTVGAPLDPVEVRTRLERAQDPDEPGEVLVRGPTLLVGVRGGQGPGLTEEGWLATGDLGRLDEDGHLWITGRKSHRIVTGGVTVDPREVQAVLVEHVDVREAAVVGIPDEAWGERVAAAVVLHEDAQSDAEALQAHCREALAGSKLPRAFVLVDELPLNANGKVDRDAVLALFE